MTIHLKMFAALAEKSRVGETRLELAAGATVSQAIEQVARQYPSLAPMLAKAAAAVNLDLADRALVLKDGDELALLPPVSGG